MISNTILVTGAPRSGTTPMGDALRHLPGAVSLYEPLGLSGDGRVTVRFPIPGEPAFTEETFGEVLEDMRRFRLRFHKQRRPVERVGWMRAAAVRVVGTRALMSQRIARLTPRKDTLIWKDPMAVFCVRHEASHGFRSVITVRPPLAQAASYKRLAWRPRTREIYDRYAARFGPVPEVADRLDELEYEDVGSSALLWHLIHRHLLRVTPQEAGHVHFFAPQVRGQDDQAAFDAVFDWLGRTMPAAVRHNLVRRAAASGSGSPKERRVHDWNRTSAQANTYWKEVLTEDEVALVEDINGGLWDEVRAHIIAHC